MGKILKVAVIFGMGGAALDPTYGERYLNERLEAKGFTTHPVFDWTDRQGVYAWLKSADWRAIVGDSMGASWGPVYAGDLYPTEVDYVAGFQPSVYAMPVSTIPPNVRFARCIRDPNWLDTFGLGHATWVAQDSKHTTLCTTEIRAAHPDDYGEAQDLVFNEICRLAQ